jgi:hypothetical protein
MANVPEHAPAAAGLAMVGLAGFPGGDGVLLLIVLVTHRSRVRCGRDALKAFRQRNGALHGLEFLVTLRFIEVTSQIMDLLR